MKKIITMMFFTLSVIAQAQNEPDEQIPGTIVAIDRKENTCSIVPTNSYYCKRYHVHVGLKNSPNNIPPIGTTVNMVFYSVDGLWYISTVWPKSKPQPKYSPECKLYYKGEIIRIKMDSSVTASHFNNDLVVLDKIWNEKKTDTIRNLNDDVDYLLKSMYQDHYWILLEKFKKAKSPEEYDRIKTVLEIDRAKYAADYYGSIKELERKIN